MMNSMRWWTTAAYVMAGSPWLQAQLSMPAGIMRGDVVSWSGTSRAGELNIRNPQNAIYGCLFDMRTYFERDHRMIAVGGLAAGDPVEVVADRKPGATTCYARTVHVVDVPAHVRERRVRGSGSRVAGEAFIPRGDMTFGGVVVRHGQQTLTIMTRNGAETLLLRPDTKYLGGGIRLDAAALLVNTHVFVRAGRNLEGGVEAYQVVWGEILPR